MSTQFNLAIVVTGIDKGAAKMAQKTGSAVAGMGKAGVGAGKNMGTLEGAMDKFKKSVLPAVGIVVGFGLAVNEAFEFAEEGAQIERLRESGDQLASSLGGNMNEIVQKVRAASLGMVADTEIISGANRAMMLGLGANADQLADLMEVAAFRARAMGLTTTQAFNDIVTGVGRQSKLILDNLGIVVNTTTVYEEWAAANGVVAASMTDAQKKAALLNSVLVEGRSQIEGAGGLALDAAGKFEQFGANVENSTNRLKEFAAGVGEAVVTSLNVILFSGDMIDQALGEQSQRLAEGSSSWEEYEAAVIETAKAAGVIQDGFNGFIDDQGRLIQVLDTGRIQYHELASEVQFLTKGTFKAIKVQEDWTQAIGFDAPAAVSNYVDAARAGARASRELAESSQEVFWSMDELKTLMAGPVGEENERFAEQQADIQEEMEETALAIEGLGASFDRTTGTITSMGGAFGANATKAMELQGAYQGVAGSLDEAAATHREKMNNIIFDLVMAELAVGGFTEAEAELASRFAQDMGLIDESTATAMQGVASAMAGFAESEGVETALWRLGQVRDTALSIPNTIPIAIRVQGGAALAQSITGGFGPPPGTAVPGAGPAVFGTKAQQTTTTVGGATTFNFNISDPASVALAMKQAEDAANASATAGYGGG